MNPIVSKIALLFLLIQAIVCKGVAQTTMTSPDGNIKVAITAGDQLTSLLLYHVLDKNQPVLKEGTIGIEIKEAMPVSGWKIINKKQGTNNHTWKPVCGERNKIVDHYNSLSLTLGTTEEPNTKIRIDFRVYNEGIAWNYLVANKQSHSSITLQAERSTFVFTEKNTAWVSTTAQGYYRPLPVNDIKEAAERPLTVKVADTLYLALGEAALVDFARMKLVNNGQYTLTTVLAGETTQGPVLQSPWRYILIGHSPGDLLSKNDLLLNLNKPSQIKNTAWIKPGTVLRETSLTTEGSLAAIDFASLHHISYILFDAGWYGKETADSSDATRVMLDPDRSKGPLDLQRVIAYSKAKNIGIILYVNRRALERQLDTLFPLYHKWGIKGVKFGFVQVGSQQSTSWLHEAVRKAAVHNLLVDIHDEYRPTGYSRTWPNLLTQEGIRGDEESPPNAHTLTTLFTRMIAGAGDNTNAYFTKRVDKMGSHASQLAKSVCLYSPWQFLYWYDRPAKKSGQSGETIIIEVPELAFFDHLPTTWDDTKILEGEIAKYATIARKKGQEWYIGSLTGDAERNVTIPCSFLEKSKQYTAFIYTDDESSSSPTRVKVETVSINSNTRLSYVIKKNNGMAIRIIAAAGNNK